MLKPLMKGLKIASVMTFVVLLIGAYQPVSAQRLKGSSDTHAPNVPVVDDPASPAKVAPGHALKNTYLRQGDYNTTVPGNTYTPLDTAITVACPSGPCSISGHLLAENGDTFDTGNYSVLVFYVDGSPVNCCWIVGATPSDGSFVNVTQDGFIGGLATGDHTVQLYYLSAEGAFVAHWAATYSLYEP